MTSLVSISLLTPTYNQGGFIEEAICSVLDQGYPNLQYIVVDGGSTDGTLDILDKYSDRVTWFSEPDRGQSHALNKGLRLMTGEVVGFLNSDDILLPGALAIVGKFFRNNPDAFWVTGKCRIIDQNGIEIRKAITAYKNFWLRFRSYKILSILNYISQPATFWRRDVVEREGYFNERLNYAMDYDYWLRVGQHYRLWLLNDYLACYRIHAKSKAGASPNAQFDTELEILQSLIQSPFTYWLHFFHSALIVSIYRWLSGRSRFDLS